VPRDRESIGFTAFFLFFSQCTHGREPGRFAHGQKIKKNKRGLELGSFTGSENLSSYFLLAPSRVVSSLERDSDRFVFLPKRVSSRSRSPYGSCLTHSRLIGSGAVAMAKEFLDAPPRLFEVVVFSADRRPAERERLIRR
jgi:hypothetical protein